MKIIIGLGNPGEKYRYTRHNTGWLVVDKLAKKWELTWQTDEKTATLRALKKTESTEIILVKPQTYMNESGKAVSKIVSRFKGLKVQDDVWVIHDDLDLDLGRIKIVKARGSAGHKGVESIIKELGSQDFVRFRIGTAKSLKLKAKSYKDYVLGEFKGEEKELWQKTIDRCAEAILYALENGMEKAMNKYNQI